jgi:hypothetical protein
MSFLRRKVARARALALGFAIDSVVDTNVANPPYYYTWVVGDSNVAPNTVAVQDLKAVFE